MVLIKSRTRGLAERHHLGGRIGGRKQSRRRLVDARVGRLRGEHDRDQQRERIDVLQFALGLGIGGLEAPERLRDLGRCPWRQRAVAAFAGNRGPGFGARRLPARA